MSPIDIEILKDALRCLSEYHRLCTPMLDVHPHGNHGHSIGVVIRNLREVILAHDLTCESRDDVIPALVPITRLVRKLQLEDE